MDNDNHSHCDCPNCGYCHEAHEGNDKAEIIRLIAAAVIFAAGIILSKLSVPEIIPAIIFAVCLIISGYRVFWSAVKNILKGKVFDENFLMAVASIAAFCIGQFSESAAVLLFYQVGEFLQDLATDRSKKSISDLMNLRPDYANLKTDNGFTKVAPEKVKKGDIIEIKPGEKVPLDGMIVEGASLLDTSGLTGEAVPRSFKVGDEIKSGFVNTDSVIAVKVTKEFSESTVSKIINLVENASSKKATAENFITKFARIYTPIVTSAALLIAVIPPLFLGQVFADWLYRAVVFLVVSCPCALVVSVPLGYFAGIGAASHNGVLIKGGNYLEMLSNVDTIVFDKTGTLTKGVFEVTNISCENGVTREKLLETAALAQTLSNHPIAKSIMKAFGKTPERSRISDFKEEAGMGVSAKADIGTVFAGNEKLMKLKNIEFTPNKENGTLVYIALDNKFLGSIVISDIVKDNSPAAVSALKELGIKNTVMLTGDRKSAADIIGSKIGLDEVHAELLPGEKVSEYEKIASGSDLRTAYVGDGINDAPVLARSDVGIAMGGIGSDAAVEAADIVIMDDDPLRLASAVKISRYVRRIVKENIVFALAVKFAVLILGAVGIANIWAAVFADTGVTLIAVFNSLRTLINKKKF